MPDGCVAEDFQLQPATRAAALVEIAMDPDYRAPKTLQRKNSAGGQLMRDSSSTSAGTAEHSLFSRLRAFGASCHFYLVQRGEKGPNLPPQPLH